MPEGSRKSTSLVVTLKFDISRYSSGGMLGAISALLFHRGLWAVLEYRVERWFLVNHWIPRYLRRIIGLSFAPVRLFTRIVTGIELPATVVAGPGLHFPHAGPIVFHNAASVGAYCTICQGVTVGISGRGGGRGVPTIEKLVYIGPNATVVGVLSVGHESLIGANSLVTRDVPPRATVVGVPAKIVNYAGSLEYLVNIPAGVVDNRNGAG